MREHRIVAVAGLMLLLCACHPVADKPADSGEVIYPLVQVYDGDTIAVMTASGRESVRLIGIDAPESDGPYTKKECQSDEAAAGLAGLLSGQAVALIPDPSQDDRDKYGRLLRYVHNSAGLDAAQYLLEQGLAREYTYRVAYDRQSRYREAEQGARQAGQGLWAEGACPE